MPLNDVTVDAIPADSQFLIFYSSRDEAGRMWCPDCRDVEQLVVDTFTSDGAPKASIVYVGDRPTWKSPTSSFRAEPWKLTSIPTVFKVVQGEEVARLVDPDINAKTLTDFVKA